jgi:hypothetical protein
MRRQPLKTTASQQLRAIFESMECSDSFLYQVRKLEASNSSWYDLSEGGVGK